MLQKPWFKVSIWFLATSLFFMGSSIIISEFSPGPTEQQVMQFMSGMMNSMSSSLMGLSMSIEEDVELTQLIQKASMMIMPLIIISLICAIYVKFKRSKN